MISAEHFRWHMKKTDRLRRNAFTKLCWRGERRVAAREQRGSGDLLTVRIVPTLRTVITKPRLIHMAKSARKRTPSTIVNRTVLRRPLNSDVRPREYLTEKEIERLQETARKRSRYGHRDATMILIAYQHGLRASELCGLRWDQIELNSGRLHVRRAKGGIDNVPAERRLRSRRSFTTCRGLRGIRPSRIASKRLWRSIDVA
jgi:integrase